MNRNREDEELDEFDERLGKIELWIAAHDNEHVNLVPRIENEVRRKVRVDINAAVAHVEELIGKNGPIQARLTAQDTTLALLQQETQNQTPILRKAGKQLRANAKERQRRKIEDAQYKRWMKRLASFVAAVIVAIEAYDKFLSKLVHPH